MNSLRFGTAVSALALTTMLAGCAAPSFRSASNVSSAKANLAYGLRAQMALESGDVASAIDLAEKAVQANPNDATVRGLLANAYFAAGRFSSADSAYGDALALSPAQPQVVLKRALTQIAQGKNSEALSLLESARYHLEAADYGLAVALAGQPAEAITVLEPAARAQGADARVRQNLALAYALSGDWTAARTIAGQDLAPDQVDARVQQWMSLAKPGRPSDQVTALVGISPAAADPGRPAQLALTQDSGTYAAAAPQPAVQVVEAAPAFVEPVVPAPQSVEAASVPPPAAPRTDVQAIAAAAAISPEAPAAFAAMTSSFAPAPKPAAVPTKRAPARPAAAKAKGDSKAVIQLGAYSSAERVSVAWERLTKKYPALANYAPMRARFDGPKGTVWRLSIKGFDTQRAAIQQCQTLRSRGGNCFVRSTNGDAPVQFASR